ncbi:MAG: cupredoxin domain-containing protein [Candidatus Limnocylindrales bacterium]
MSRTFAMQVVAGAYWVLTLTVVYIFVGIIVPSLDESPDALAFLPIFVGFIAVFVGAAAVATFLPSAPVRRRLWLVLIIPPVLFLLLNAPYIPYSLTHPADLGFTAVLPMVLMTAVIAAAGFAAFREAGGAVVERWTGVRSRIVMSVIAGVVLGGSATGYLAATSAGGGTALTGAPTTTATLVAEKTMFLTTSYSIEGSDTMGLFVENRDAFAHSFDIDELDLHVQLPADSTVALTIKPTASGPLAFYCAIPGHLEAGMAGTIEVK